MKQHLIVGEKAFLFGRGEGWEYSPGSSDTNTLWEFNPMASPKWWTRGCFGLPRFYPSLPWWRYPLALVRWVIWWRRPAKRKRGMFAVDRWKEGG